MWKTLWLPVRKIIYKWCRLYPRVFQPTSSADILVVPLAALLLDRIAKARWISGIGPTQWSAATCLLWTPRKKKEKDRVAAGCTWNQRKCAKTRFWPIWSLKHGCPTPKMEALRVPGSHRSFCFWLGFRMGFYLAQAVLSGCSKFDKAYRVMAHKDEIVCSDVCVCVSTT